MATYDVMRRLDKLEQRVDIRRDSRTGMLLAILREHGYEVVERFINESEELQGRPFWHLMNAMDDTEDPLVFERYRGLVPDEVIRRAYNMRRNWAGNEVRRLAGVIDGDGRVMPGYVMLDNGCIADAPLAVVE